MHPAVDLPDQMTALPDHTQLPDRDGAIVINFQESPQSNMLTDSLRPRLLEIHPDGQFAVGCDSGIYWRYTEPVLDGCKSPDWFYVPNVPPMLDGIPRRSYVLWKEGVRPLLVIEYVSRDGSEEHDTAPYKGKFWVYEQAICAAYYAIFDGWRGTLEVYRLDGGRYRQLTANEAGRYPVEPLRIELGLWEGHYRGITGHWVRAWDAATGEMFTLSEERETVAVERAESAEGLLDDMQQYLSEETERAEAERKRAEDEKRRADEEKLRAEDEKRRADEEKLRAEDEKRRADAAESTLTEVQQRIRQMEEKLRSLGLEPEG